MKSINVIHHINSMKDKTHMISLLDAEKIFDKVPHHVMIKALEILQIQRSHQAIVNINLTGEKTLGTK